MEIVATGKCGSKEVGGMVKTPIYPSLCYLVTSRPFIHQIHQNHNLTVQTVNIEYQSS
jgi:hypothetical protein